MKPLEKDLYKLFKKVEEDAVMAAGDVGAVGGDEVPAADPDDLGIYGKETKVKDYALSNTDVLGKFNPKDGCFGPGDFHLPQRLSLQRRLDATKKKKGEKRPIYLKFANI